jgi:hypothetical protein
MYKIENTQNDFFCLDMFDPGKKTEQKILCKCIFIPVQVKANSMCYCIGQREAWCKRSHSIH